MLPVYMKCTNGCYYKNPVLWSTDWFIRFNGIDLPELIIKQIPKLDNIERAKQIMDGLNVRYNLLNSTNIRVAFPPGYAVHFNAVVTQFELYSPLPFPQSWEDVIINKNKIKGSFIIHEGNDSRWQVVSNSDDDKKIYPHIVTIRNSNGNIAKFKTVNDAELFIIAKKEETKPSVVNNHQLSTIKEKKRNENRSRKPRKTQS